MESRMRVVVLAVLCAVCAVFILILTGRQDTAAPVIEFERTPVYYNGKDKTTLLEGVTAVDARDGDVSDTLMVSYIYPVSEETGIVVYAAKDRSNNVTMAGRGFFCQGYDRSGLPGVAGGLNGAGEDAGTGVAPGAYGDSDGEAGDAGGTGMDGDQAGAGGNADGTGTAGNDAGAEGTGDRTGTGGAGDAGADGTGDQAGAGNAGAEGQTEPGSDDAGDGTGTAGDDAGAAGGNLPGDGSMSEEQYDRLREQNLAQGIPFVRLVQYEAVLERGSAFNIYRYIDEAVDDVDSIQTMLRVEGSVDTDAPGEYEVRVFAKDSDGNESNVETLMVTVE